MHAAVEWSSPISNAAEGHLQKMIFLQTMSLVLHPTPPSTEGGRRSQLPMQNSEDRMTTIQMQPNPSLMIANQMRKCPGHQLEYRTWYCRGADPQRPRPLESGRTELAEGEKPTLKRATI